MTRLFVTLRAYVLGIAATIVHGVRVLVCARLGERCARRACYQAPRGWSRAMLRGAGVRVELVGVEHLAPPRPAVLVCNHQSWFDVFALAGHLPVDFRFVGKRELARIPVFGAAWLACGHIAIDRSNRAAAIRSLNEAGRRLTEDEAVVVMFPEGTRSTDGRLLPFKKGAFMLALQLGVPIIPVAVAGTRAIMPKGAWTVRPGTIELRFGAPIEVTNYAAADRDVLVDIVRQRMLELREPRMAGDPPAALDDAPPAP